jgi:hypothetical protein
MSSFRTCIRISAALLLFVVATNAHALGPKGDIYLGYSRLGSNTFEPTNGGLNGLEGAAHLKIRRFLGVEADVAH